MLHSAMSVSQSTNKKIRQTTDGMLGDETALPLEEAFYINQ